MKIVWKYINGHGPYAYVQESVREGDKVTSRHVAYLGRGGGALSPGTTVRIKGDVATVPALPPSAAGVAPKRRADKARQYVVRNADGDVVYVGQTNDLRRRTGELRRDGTLPDGGRVEAETDMISRDAAERSETKRVAGHRDRHGQPPTANEVTPRAPGARRLDTPDA